MKTIYELQKTAGRLRDAKEANSISPEDTFGLQADVLEYLADMEQSAEGLGIHKVYASYAEMLEDASAPVGSNGKAMRFGQLAAIYDSSDPTSELNGNVYAWQKGNTGESAWLLMGNLGSIDAMQSQIDWLKERVARHVMVEDLDTFFVENQEKVLEGEYCGLWNAPGTRNTPSVFLRCLMKHRNTASARWLRPDAS